MKNKIKKYYEKNSTFTDYQKSIEKGLWNSEEKIIQKYKQNFPEEIKILDLGCGTGRTTFALNQIFPKAEILAIDIVPKMINFAKSLNHTDKIQFICDDILKYDFKNLKFDLIIFSFNGFTHILSEKEVNLFMNKIHSLLKDNNSKYIFTIHNMFSNEEYEKFWKEKINVDSLKLFDNKKILEDEEVKNRFYRPEDIIKIANMYNFKILESFKRDDLQEPEWVLKISEPVIFYVFSKEI